MEITPLVICDCGYPKDNHNFRHSFQGNIKVEREMKEGVLIFRINTLQYRESTKTGRCCVPFCNLPKILHKTPDKITESSEMVFDESIPRVLQIQTINHIFQQKPSYIMRYINFVVPEDTKCIKCNETLKEHYSLTHIFRTLVYLDNVGDNDEINIIADNEKKIDWKSKC